MSLLLFSQHTMPDPTSVSASTNMIVGFGGDGGGPTPVFTLPLQNLTVQVGRNATFTCYVRHIQRYQVSRSSRAQRRGGRKGGRVRESRCRTQALGLVVYNLCVGEIVPRPSFRCISRATSFPPPSLRCAVAQGRDTTILDSRCLRPWTRSPLLLLAAFH